MTYFDDPNETFVAAEFTMQSEDGRQTYGVRTVVPILPEEIEPYKKNIGFKGNIYYTTDVKRQELFTRLEQEYGYQPHEIGYDIIRLINQTQLSDYIGLRRANLAELNWELERFNAR